MKIHSTNYFNTLIEVAEDCPTNCAEVPKPKGNRKTVAEMQYELLAKHPFQYTSDDIIFQIFAERKDLTKSDYEEARKAFFSKGQPCFRASPLPKRYGFGIYSNQDGKVALLGRDTEEYELLVNDPKVKKVKAMRSSKK